MLLELVLDLISGNNINKLGSSHFIALFLTQALQYWVLRLMDGFGMQKLHI